MSVKEGQLGMGFGELPEPQQDFVQLDRCIEDRGSVYSVTLGKVTGKEDIKKFMNILLKDKRYKKATHNTYAVRLSKDGVLWEGKRDDGETGAGMIILRELQRQDMVNCIVVVTRWYGGVKLQGDRFRHVQDATKMVLEEIA